MRKDNKATFDSLLNPDKVIVPPSNRSSRPRNIDKESTDNHNNEEIQACPFCSGNEDMTPPTLLQIPEKGAWQVRVFKNLYPLLDTEMQDEKYGVHEVIVETPKHDALFHTLSVSAIAEVMRAVKERIAYHYQNPDIKAVIAFRNQGFRGGASLQHPHSQLVGLSWVPPTLQFESETFLNLAEKGYCPLCMNPGDSRIIVEADSSRAFSPIAPRFPYETWIAPLHHEPSFSNLSDVQIDDLAFLTRRVLNALQVLNSRIRANKPFDYNIIIHTEPNNDDSGTFHTHIEIIPRFEAIAGFELGSGLLVNHVDTQQAISDLREILLS